MEAHRLCDRLIYALTCMPPKLVAIVELSLSFLSEGALIDALMFVKGSYDISGLISGAGKGWCTEQFAGGADKTGKVHSGEGKLL